MTRKLVVETAKGDSPVLEEVEAHDEAQLQERLKQQPDLLPLAELGLGGPALVVGRETPLASGKIDLVLLGNGGDLCIVEFKTGPSNPDFRSCIAQLLDYGSDLWKLSLDEFEAQVAARYFRSDRCPPGAPGAGGDSLAAAAQACWGKPSEDDAVDWREQLISSTTFPLWTPSSAPSPRSPTRRSTSWTISKR